MHIATSSAETEVSSAKDAAALVGKIEGKKLSGRPGRIWEDDC